MKLQNNLVSNQNQISFNRKHFITPSTRSLKNDILQCKSVEECADVYEKVIEQAKNINYNRIRSTIHAVQMCSALSVAALGVLTVATSSPVLGFIGTIVGITGTVFTTKMMKQQKLIRGQDEETMYKDMMERKTSSSDIYADLVPALHPKKTKKLQEDEQLGLLDALQYQCPQNTPDKNKIKEFIAKKYPEYSWNKLMNFCVSNCFDYSRNASYENFEKLYNMSKDVYKMLNNTHRISKPDTTKISGELYECFKEEYPFNELCELIPHEAMRDENGIIQDAEINKFKEFCKFGLHQAIETLRHCRNSNGTIAWNAAETFRDLSVTVDNILYKMDYAPIEKARIKDAVLYNISSALRSGKDFDTKKLNNIYSEIGINGIKNSETLKKIFPSELKTTLGMKDDNVESVAEAISKDSRLFDLYIHTNGNICRFLYNTNASPSEVFAFLCKMTSNPNYRKIIARQFSANPRMGEKIKTLLINKLGGDKKADNYFSVWYHDENHGYRKAYADYYCDEIWDKAKSLDELIKQSPNLGPWAFLSKAKELNTEPELGKIPDDFQNLEVFSELITKIKEHKKNLDKMSKRAGFDKAEFKRPYEIQAGTASYIITPLSGGHSAKDKIIITPKNDNAKPYILKFLAYDLHGKTYRTHAFMSSYSIKPDTAYPDAMVDFYLKQNDCPQAPDIKYFNYNLQAALYGLTEGTRPEYTADNLYLFVRQKEISDIKDLGIELNDFHNGNFLEENGEYKLIDSGHVKFTSPFRPMVIAKHITIGNLCGREIYHT